MFTCPKCSKPTRILVYASDERGCPECNDPGDQRSALLHSVSVVGNQGIKLTHADAMRIKTNTRQADGTYKSAARWRSRGTDWGS